MKNLKRFIEKNKLLTLFIASILLFILYFLAINFVLNVIIEIIDKTFISGSVLHPEPISISLSFFFIVKYSSLILLLTLVILSCIVLSLTTIYKIHNSFSSLMKNQKGSSRFATFEEIKEQYRDIPEKAERFEGSGGVPVARYQDRVFIDDSSVNNLVVGTTRSGKGEMFVIPTIDIYSRAKTQASMVINDPKGELLSASKETLEGLGYHVEVLNLINPNQSMSYNPLEVVKKEFLLKNYSQAQQYALSLSFMLYNEKKSSDQIWAKASTNLCTALILALCEINKDTPERINMYNLTLMLSELSSKIVKDIDGNEEEELIKFFEQFPSNHPARLQFASYAGALGVTRASILMNTITPLGIFSLENIGKLTSKNSFEMEKVGFNHWIRGTTLPLAKMEFEFKDGKRESVRSDEKGEFVYYHSNHMDIGDEFTISVKTKKYDKEYRFTVDGVSEEGNVSLSGGSSDIKITSCLQYEKPVAIFMIVPDYDESFNIIASLYVKQLYTTLARAATLSPSGKCFREVVFILDEFGNMPLIEGMANIITVCLGRNIRFNLIVQSYSQLKWMYGDQWKTITGNCGNMFYLLTADKDTADAISAELDDKTVVNQSRSGRTLSINKSRTESPDNRRLMTTAEIMGLKEGEMIVIRVIKRQDKERNRIKQYPLYLRGETAMKYRWEYLSEYYSTGRSINDIDIPCSHAMTRLEDLKLDYTLMHGEEEEAIIEEPEDVVSESNETVLQVLGEKNTSLIERYVLPKYKLANDEQRPIEYFLEMDILTYIDVIKRLVLLNLLEERIANIFIKTAKSKGYEV